MMQVDWGLAIMVAARAVAFCLCAFRLLFPNPKRELRDDSFHIEMVKVSAGSAKIRISTDEL
jgi:hypothetical protein